MTTASPFSRFGLACLRFRVGFVLLSAGAAIWPVRAANSPAAYTVDDYLELLHYEPVPFRVTERGQPLAPADLGDGRKRVLLVDTGWSTTTLDERVAHGLKILPPTNAALSDTLRGSVTNASRAVLENLTLGRTQFPNQPVRVKKLEVDYVTLPYDGVLGLDFLLRNACLIDCLKRRLYVRSATPAEAESGALAETLRRSGFVEIPMRFRGLIVTISAEINQQPVRLCLDTGAAFSMLDEAAAARLGLTVIKGASPPTGSLIPEDLSGSLVGVNMSGRRQLRVTTLDTFQLGPRIWKNVRFGLANLQAWGFDKPGTPTAGIAGFFGPEYLTGKGALIDLATRTLWLRPEKPTASAKGTSR